MFGNLTAVRLLIAAGLVMLTACSGGGDSGSDGTDDTESALFDCIVEECDAAAGEFCLVEYYANGELDGGRCVQASCTDCDCAQDAAYDYFDGASNCDGMIGCNQDDEQITVECTNAPM